MRTALVLFLVLAASPALAANGQAVFTDKCGECHSTAPASATDTAPSLKGVVGRKVASLPGFQYSAALKAKGGVWTEAALDAFLANPSAYAPGTNMFGGAPDPADRTAIIDYLKSVK
jgi:cytochrome c